MEAGAPRVSTQRGLPVNQPGEEDSQEMERVLTPSLWPLEPDTPATSPVPGLHHQWASTVFCSSQFELGFSHLQARVLTNPVK